MIKNVILDIGGVLVDYNKKKYYTMKGYSDEMASRLEAATMDSPYWEHYDIGLMPEEWIRNKMKSYERSEPAHGLKCFITLPTDTRKFTMKKTCSKH